jgi:hypothetical protein
MLTRIAQGRRARWWSVLVLLVCGLSVAAAAADEGALPAGAIAFFNTPTCPAGWTALDLAQGRFVVPLMAGGGNGATLNPPLKPGEDRRHQHHYSTNFKTQDVHYAGVKEFLGYRKDVAKHGTVTIEGTTTKASTHLPYVQLLICQKMTAADPSRLPPPKLLLFFGILSCPAGWSQMLPTRGRLLVGLPENGTAGAAFGGRPLKPLENRAHQHTFSGSVSTRAQGVGLASGCCATGYAKNKTYSYEGTTDPAAAVLPYVQLLQCESS